ncbi:MAG: aminoacyl-tRNA hydrolase [Candidatus Vogelbacteria bacterium]|nr:aminoacyl-tRNA hydrolase [Candidatus Vogelbacteria bacterium]
MNYLIFGLGNPGAEYEKTRHNLGARVAAAFREKTKNRKLVFLEPTTYMNKSGEAAAKIIKSKKAASSLIVIHDDLDLPLGRFKISFGRGAGGHRGVDSIIKKLKTQDFIRLRVGTAPSTPSGKLKKPVGEKAVVDFILAKFTPQEEIKLKRLTPKLFEALAAIAAEGLAAAMNRFNQ